MEGSTPSPPTDPVTEAALRSLKDIAVPAPASWMPQTWGWALVAIILAILVIVTLWHWLRRYRANAYRREALGQLAGLEAEIHNPLKRTEAIQSLAILLKRVALAAWPREDVASLSSAAWVRFLKEHDSDLGTALGQALDDLEYRGETATAGASSGTDDLISAARHWIERHHVSA